MKGVAGRLAHRRWMKGDAGRLAHRRWMKGVAGRLAHRRWMKGVAGRLGANLATTPSRGGRIGGLKGGAMSHDGRRRFHGYDYARGGSMFITGTLAARRPLFGRVEQGKMMLSQAGEAARRDLLGAAAHFVNFITIRSFEIMPDHVHVRFTWPAGFDDAVARIGHFVGRFKQLSTWHIAGRGPSIWSKLYHDLLCTSERMNRTVDAYIGNNALKWWLMHGDRSLMHVVEPLQLGAVEGDELWRGVGEVSLLDRARLVSIRISQRVPSAELPRVVEDCLRTARMRGYVYVSTFYSPGEKALFRKLAAESDLPTIRLIPTFMELAYRPHGDEPCLFARKRLLVLSRMRDPLAAPRRGELLELNAIAATLARLSEGGKAVYVQWQNGRVIYGVA